MTAIRVPEKYKEELSVSQNYAGLMGLSVGKQEFLDRKCMTAYSSFMHEHFPESLFLIADLPKIHNIIALEGTSWKEAERRVLIAGDDMRRGLERVVRGFPSIQIGRWADFQNIYYDVNLQVLQQEYACDDLKVGFGRRVDEEAQKFLELPANKPRWINRCTIPVSIAKNYVLDELAMLASLPFSFERPVCEIYPGRNILQEDVQTKRIFGVAGRLMIKPDICFMEAYHEPSST